MNDKSLLPIGYIRPYNVLAVRAVTSQLRSPTYYFVLTQRLPRYVNSRVTFADRIMHVFKTTRRVDTSALARPDAADCNAVGNRFIYIFCWSVGHSIDPGG